MTTRAFRPRWRGTILGGIGLLVFLCAFYAAERPLAPGAKLVLYVSFFVGFVGGVIAFRDTLAAWREKEVE
jgi:hypothetical protein